MKTVLKFTATAITALIMTNAWAADDSRFAKAKQDILDHSDKQIAKLQKHKTCVASAQDQEALKKCHEGMREGTKELKDELLEKRRDRLDNKLKEMEEEKK